MISLLPLFVLLLAFFTPHSLRVLLHFRFLWGKRENKKPPRKNFNEEVFWKLLGKKTEFVEPCFPYCWFLVSHLLPSTLMRIAFFPLDAYHPNQRIERTLTRPTRLGLELKAHVPTRCWYLLVGKDHTKHYYSKGRRPLVEPWNELKLKCYSSPKNREASSVINWVSVPAAKTRGWPEIVGYSRMLGSRCHEQTPCVTISCELILQDTLLPERLAIGKQPRPEGVSQPRRTLMRKHEHRAHTILRVLKKMPISKS